MSSQLFAVLSIMSVQEKEFMRPCQSLVIIFFPEEKVGNSSHNPIF